MRLPDILNNVSGRLTSIMMNFLLLRFGGTTAVSVYGVLMYADSFITEFLYGMCDALQPAVGYNWGAGNSRRISQIERYCYGTAAGVSLISAAVMILFPLKITQFLYPMATAAFNPCRCCRAHICSGISGTLGFTGNRKLHDGGREIFPGFGYFRCYSICRARADTYCALPARA